jgi:hypothetical protein
MIVTQLQPPTNLFEWMDTISKLIEIWFQAMGTLHHELGILLRSLVLGWFAFVCFGLTVLLLFTGRFIHSPRRDFVLNHNTYWRQNPSKYKIITPNQIVFSQLLLEPFAVGA